jgi:hypothetical protein
MRIFYRYLFGILSTLVCFAQFNLAQATLVYIDAKAGGASQYIDAGTYRASLIGGSWNAWGGAVGDGKGWLNNWGASLPGGGQIWHGTGVYGSPIQAFNAAHDIYFTAPTSGTMTFTNGDPKPFLADNVGGTTISITKSLGSAAKDNWNFASEIAGYASSLATLVGIAMASVTAGSLLAVMATFIALGIAGTSLALLAQGGPLTTGSLISALLNIKNLIVEVVSANYLGSPILSAAVKASLFGLVATGIEIGSAWMAKDPPNLNYHEVPALQPAPFNTGNEDDHFANSAARTVDAWAVLMDSWEKYQGALLDGNNYYAKLQLKAHENAAAALMESMDNTQKLMKGVYSNLGPVISSPSDYTEIKNRFLATDLPNDIKQLLPKLNVDENEFRSSVIEDISKLPSYASKEEIVFNLNRGIELPLASVRTLGPSEIPEPATLWLIFLGAIALAWSCKLENGVLKKDSRC